MGLSLYDRWKQMNQATSAPSASDSADLVDVSSTQTLTNKVAFLIDKTNPTLSGRTIAYGTGVMVSGTLVLATGLATVVGFSATFLKAAGTGAASTQTIQVDSIATGAVTISAYYTSTIGASGVLTGATGSSGTFYWVAIGT